MSSGCGCKEVYRFPHITYPCSSCICSFFAVASLLFVNFFMFFVLVSIRHQLIFMEFGNALDQVIN